MRTFLAQIFSGSKLSKQKDGLYLLILPGVWHLCIPVHEIQVSFNSYSSNLRKRAELALFSKVGLLYQVP